MSGRESLIKEVETLLESGDDIDIDNLVKMSSEDSSVVDILSNYIVEDEDQEAISNAVRVLGDLNPLLLVKPILAMLRSENAENRATAAYICGVYKLEETKAELEVLLENDESPDVRYWAAGSLGEVGDLLSIPLLNKALEDREWAENQDTVDAAAKESINRIRQRK